jgi:hypothetical protein
MRTALRTSFGGVLAVLIMSMGSLGLWLGTPLLWLWVGAQVQGATDSLSLAVGTMFVGVVVWVLCLAWVLSRLSTVHRENAIAAGHADPGHLMLERVLIVSAAIVLELRLMGAGSSDSARALPMARALQIPLGDLRQGQLPHRDRRSGHVQLGGQHLALTFRQRANRLDF